MRISADHSVWRYCCGIFHFLLYYHQFEERKGVKTQKLYKQSIKPKQYPSNNMKFFYHSFPQAKKLVKIKNQYKEIQSLPKEISNLKSFQRKHFSKTYTREQKDSPPTRQHKEIRSLPKETSHLKSFKRKHFSKTYTKDQKNSPQLHDYTSWKQIFLLKKTLHTINSTKSPSNKFKHCFHLKCNKIIKKIHTHVAQMEEIVFSLIWWTTR